MNERHYVSVVIPYSETAPWVAGHPAGEQLAPGALGRATTDRDLKLYLQHGGDRAHYRIPAGRVHEARHDPGGFHATFELYDTLEGERARRNAVESTRSVSPELIILCERTGPGGCRLVTDALLAGIALVPSGAYPSAKVVSVQSASERRAARFARVAATLAHAGSTPAPAAQLPPGPDMTAALALAERKPARPARRPAHRRDDRPHLARDAPQVAVFPRAAITEPPAIY